MNQSNAQPEQPAVVVPQPLSWHQKALTFLIMAVARILMKTWRIRWEDRSGMFDGSQNGPLIFCIWHNRLALSMAIYQRIGRVKRPASGLAALISASKDGGLLAEVLKKFDVQPVRGSSSRRGPQALLEATSWAEKGYHIAITPDGPRGPRYTIRDGIIGLAQVTGLPIVPVSATIRGKITTRSWDAFQIPLPFAKCIVRLGAPLQVPREIPDEQRPIYREKLRSAMMALTED